MASVANRIEQFARGLPKGAFWCTGKLIRELCAILIADRAVLAEGCGHEQPTENGRHFIVGNGGAGMSFEFAIVGGRVGTVRIPGAQLVEYTDGL